jgi:hypothetical protein
MSAEPETTLAWAEFLWQVTKETPQTVFAYLLLIELVRRRLQGKKQGRIIHLELNDSVSISDSMTATAGLQTVTIGRVYETDRAMPLKVVGGAPG